MWTINAQNYTNNRKTRVWLSKKTDLTKQSGENQELNKKKETSFVNKQIKFLFCSCKKWQRFNRMKKQLLFQI